MMMFFASQEHDRDDDNDDDVGGGHDVDDKDDDVVDGKERVQEWSGEAMDDSCLSPCRKRHPHLTSRGKAAVRSAVPTVLAAVRAWYSWLQQHLVQLHNTLSRRWYRAFPETKKCIAVPFYPKTFETSRSPP